MPLNGPGVSIFRETVAVAMRSASGICEFSLSFMYAAKVVSPLPVLPLRFLDFIGQV